MSANMQNILYLIYLVVVMLSAIFGALLFAKNTDENYSLEKADDTLTKKQKYSWFFTSWAIILFVVFNVLQSLSYFVV